MSYKTQIIENFNQIHEKYCEDDDYYCMNSRLFRIYFSIEEKKELEIIHEQDPLKKIELRRLNDLRIQKEILCAKRLRDEDDECSCVHQDDESSTPRSDDSVEGEIARSYVDSTSNLVVYIKPKILDTYKYEVEGREEKKVQHHVQIRKVHLKIKKNKMKKKKRKCRKIQVPMENLVDLVKIVQKDEDIGNNSRIGGEMVVYKERSEKKFVWKNEIFWGICVPNKRKVEKMGKNGDLGKGWRRKVGENSIKMVKKVTEKVIVT